MFFAIIHIDFSMMTGRLTTSNGLKGTVRSLTMLFYRAFLDRFKIEPKFNRGTFISPLLSS